MQTEIIIAGFGGQGVLFIGQLMAYAGMDKGKDVTWFPSYGPEMRGGTANCTVILSDEEIGAPVVRNPTAAIVMNKPSLEKYEPLVIKGGVLIINSSMVDRHANRSDIQAVSIPVNEIAERLGKKRLSNMVMLGCLLAKLPVLDSKDIELALKNHMPIRHHDFIPLNIKALHEGLEYKS